MKTTDWRRRGSIGCLFLVCAFAPPARAQSPPGGGGSLWPANKPLDSWSFSDTTNWTTDLGFAPASHSNITSAFFGDGNSVIVSNRNPAWLRYNVVEPVGTTNLTVNAGTLAFWAAPLWAGTNGSGSPGVWSRLIEVGGYSTNGLPGWWSLYTDAGGSNLFFSVQPGDGTTSNYLQAPINWSSNYFYWHFVAITYSATNTAMYLDGVLATNGNGIISWPGTSVLAGGMFIGSDSNGMNQAQAAFDDLYTYNVPLDSNAIAGMYYSLYSEYRLNPWNILPNFLSAPSVPSLSQAAPDFFTGPGYLTWLGAAGGGVTSSNVWFTNMSATPAAQGTTYAFTIAGGTNGLAYDVFATPALASPITNAVWYWMGQGYSCNTYSIAMPYSGAALFILGTPQDTDGDGLTDAYERLVSHTDPSNPDTEGGLPDAWVAINGLTGSANLAGQDPDFDGLSNAQEYLYGTKPTVSEGFAIWVSGAATSSGVP